MKRILRAALVAAGLAVSSAAIAADAPGPAFTAAQAEAGAAAYGASCALCHGGSLEGGAGPALSGAAFRHNWQEGGRHAADLYDVIAHTMPQNAPGSLPVDTDLALTAFLLSRDGYAAGPAALTQDSLKATLTPPAAADIGSPDGFAFTPPPPKPRVPRTPDQHYPIAPAGAAPASTAVPTDAELTEMAASDWLTFNRDYAGDRYSPLAQMDTSNAAKLVPVCAYQLGELGSFQNTPLVYRGTMYVTSNHRIMSIDAAKCTTNWAYVYTPTDPEHFPSARGLALYRGKVFKGTADGHLLALDAANGKLLWEAVVGDAAIGYCVSGAPVAFEGRVYVGECGGDSGIKGHIHAFDAATGKPLWSFDAIPTGNERGADSWSGGTEHGGGPSWSSLTIDPARHLVLAPIGNPGPDYNTAPRQGDNLYTNSIVALDAATGKLAWYVQQVAHDFHDWDTAAAPALFERDGHRYMAVAGKSGFLFVYDRDTRKLVAKTPTVEKFLNVDQPLSMTGPTDYCPGSHGQFNGPAYSPVTSMLFVGSEERCETVQLTDPHYRPGQGYYSGRILTKWADLGTGWLRGFDAVSGKEIWRLPFDRPINAAVTTTAGGLLLTGDTGGNFLALDQKTGKLLYRFMTGGAIAGGVASYAVDGRQYLAVASGNISRDVSAPNGAPTVTVFGLASP